MKSYVALLQELDAPMRHNLRLYVDRELKTEYQPKHRSKAQKLGPSALVDLVLEGERIKAQVLDLGTSYRVDMTFPLFDLDTDFTLIQCSCMRDKVSLEALRCHHMYTVQHRLQSLLEDIAAQEAPNERSPLDRWEQLWPAPLEGARLLDERRLVLWLDLPRWSLRCEWQSRPRYEADQPWCGGDRQSLEHWKLSLESDSDSATEIWRQALARAHGQAEREVYELLRLAATLGDVPLFGERDQPIAVSLEHWQMKIEETDEGYWLRPQLGRSELPVGRMIGAAGLVAWDATASTLILVDIDHALARFLEPLLQQEQAIPKSERERMLQFLQRLDPRLLNLAAGSQATEAQAVAKMTSVLRLTPFQRGGMKVEALVRIAPHLVVRAGEGAERVKELGERRSTTLIRDFAEERRLVRCLVKALDLELLPEPEPEVFIAYNDRCALDLMQRVESTSKELAFQLEWPESLKNVVKPYTVIDAGEKASLQISLGEKRDWFQIEGWMELDAGTKVSLQELLAALREQKRYLQLPDGRWALVSEHFRQRLQPLLVACDEDEQACRVDLAVLGHDEALQQMEQFPFVEMSQKFWQLVQKARRSRQVEESLPQGLNAELRSYQLEGFRWMNRLYEGGLGACLADDMGLGKTLQTLTLLLKKARHGPSLVIAPSSLAYNWAAESRRFCPGLRITQWREDRGLGRSFEPGEVVIVSYGLVQRHADLLAQTHWNILVLDEAQQIKNALTKTAKAVQQLQARWILALSGTPIENRLSELWALFRTISPGLFGEWERFRRSFVFPIERDRSASARERLKQKLAPFVLRRMKRDYLAELPEKTEIDLWIDLGEDERNFYDALRGEAIDRLQSLAEDKPEEQAKQRIQVLAALARLRQAACHRQLLDPAWDGEATKVEYLKERMLELKQAGHSALIFSQFTRFLRLIADALEQEGLKLLYLDGSTPPMERQRLVECFQAGGYDAFLISLKAGGTGLNLTRAAYVFHMDPWWNPAVEAQATDRAYRMGQKQAVTVYKLRARETIEELIHAIHGEKRELMETLLEGREPGQAWAWDELWALLSGRGQPSQSRGPRASLGQEDRA